MKILSILTIILINSITALGQTVTGTGTVNYISKFTGASALGNSLLFSNTTSIGIGTTTPVAKLEIEAGSGNENIRIANNIGAYSMRNGSALSFDYPVVSYHACRDATSQGTTGEISFLDRPGTFTYTKAVRTSDILLKTAHSFNGGLLGQFLDITMAISASQDGGYVGIRTSKPTTALDVNGAIRSQGYTVPTSGTGVERGYYVPGSYGQIYAYDRTAAVYKNLIIGTGGNQLCLKATGNVGIGTTNPQELLSVNGNILAKKVKVSVLAVDWPDYVFDRNYQLPALAGIEQFTHTNNHLPGVPSAAEVEKNGSDLGDMQSKLLKKIEELTLYLIEQNKKMERQTAQINNLQKQINHLTKKDRVF